ncbi:MAG: hypothetical protein AB7K68_07120 [Bacteriovoracia bacterium]
MKFLLSFLALATISSSAFAATTVLECKGNTLNGNPRRIEIQANAITVIFDDQSVMSGETSSQNRGSPNTYFNVVGFDYGIPKALLNGRVKEAGVLISSYDYPYEEVSCTRQ